MSIKSSGFVHLHNHSQYSLLDGLSKIPQTIELVKDYGMEAVALTDHGTLSGSIEFYKTATAAGIKPIIGIETYLAVRSIHDKDPIKDKSSWHLILLAKNYQGYQNLMRLSTIANLDGFYYRPRIDRQLLDQYGDGLIVLSGCIGGELGDALRQNQYSQAKQIAQWYQKRFGADYFIEIQDHGHPDHPRSWAEQVTVTEQSLKLAQELKIEAVLTSDAHYLKPSNQTAHEVLLCVQTGSFLNDSNRMSLADFDLSLSDPRQLIKRWGKEHPQLIENTRKIADSCQVEIELGQIRIPNFELPKGQSQAQYLAENVYQNLLKLYPPKKPPKDHSIKNIHSSLPKIVADRVEYELSVIDKMNFNSYFLIIADFINWGKSQDIFFGPGRGSAAGSIVAYALKITEIDPLKYDLLFERFLNPDRISMPDIDIDIQDNRRDEVIQYCIQKYGQDRVANIVTFGTMAARNAVRDVARVLQVPYTEADRLAKLIPPPVQGRHIPLAKSLKSSSLLKTEYQSSALTKQVFDLAIELEGTVRSHGVHAAGVVIAPDAIVKFVPLERAQKGVITTQYSMGPIDELGLLKIDFLGLSNLTIIRNCLRIVKKVYGKKIDIGQIDLKDSKTFKLLQSGQTTGIFQLESSGMKRYLKELKPTVFEDIIAMGALYRPGPLTAGLTDKFIARKNGREKVIYDHPLMAQALKDTYGVMVYQEQFMQIARDMCGFSGPESDTLRKAVGKKNRTLMAKMQDQVISGALSKGVKKAVAEKFWQDLEGFADYAFNKSHATCYGLIAYQTAYLKAHFPIAFMAALMTSDYDNTDRLAIEINDCRHQGIDVLPPDINQSFEEFAVVPNQNQIRFGLNAVKNVGYSAAQEILRARGDKPFKSIQDFLSRANHRIINKKVLDSLIRSGGFDSFGDRHNLLQNLELLSAYAIRQQKQTQAGQTDLFSHNQSEVSSADLVLAPNNESPNPKMQSIWERELLGLSLSQGPKIDISQISGAVPIKQLIAGQYQKFVASIDSVRPVTTKKGQAMAFVKLSDSTDEIEGVIFPKVYKTYEYLLSVDIDVVVEGHIQSEARTLESGELKVIVETMADLSTYQQNPSLNHSQANNRVYIRLDDSQDQDKLLALKQTLDNHPGSHETVLVLGPDEQKQAIKLPNRVKISQLLTQELEQIAGAEKVKIS